MENSVIVLIGCKTLFAQIGGHCNRRYLPRQMYNATMQQQALTILKKRFGYDSFRGQQADIIDAVASGQDALVLMPTGGGKSLCYQIPALLREGVGVVVSPLIALMQDQVDALSQQGIQAAFLNSTLSGDEQWAVIQQLQSGQLDMLYVAPERLVQPRMLEILAATQIALFAIDEAHCVSQWGHDFRADYLSLNLLAEQFPNVPRIALTATANQRTRDEIILRLALRGAASFVSSFDRPNIRYAIAAKNNPRKQLKAFLNQRRDEAGVIYCLSRKKVEDTAQWLCDQGYSALPYHAGLPANLREYHQQRFLREEGVIIVATIAFGMGIDKPDVRFVAHLDLPKSIEAYYQETGRAGRDGQPAEAWMVYGLQDVIRLQQMTSDSQASEQFQRSERHKLDAMLGLCELTSCRRQSLLSYFGDAASDHCDNCDNCQIPPETWDATEAAQKLLSCVYRTGQRFGSAHIVDVLLGKSTDKVEQHGHKTLTTFGIGSDISEAQWRALIRQLVVRGLLRVDVENYSALQLVEASRAVLRGEETLLLRHEQPAKKSTATRKAKTLVSDDQQPLFDALRDCRKRLAEENGVPPYVIFHDATLMEMVEQQPTSRMEMLAITGVGESKLEKYGGDFIEVLVRHQLDTVDELAE